MVFFNLIYSLIGYVIKERGIGILLNFADKMLLTFTFFTDYPSLCPYNIFEGRD